ncbi:hypothetical protein IW262DRAFT_1511527, partial [Armillaria fumosa]
SASDYLGRFYHQSRHGWSDYVFDGHLSCVHIDERGRIVFTGLASKYSLFYYTMDIIQNSQVRPEVKLLRPPVALDTSPSGLFRSLNSLLHYTILDRTYLIDIYDVLYFLMDTMNLCPHPPSDLGRISTRTALTPPVDCLVVGQILFESTEQTVAWEVVHNNGDSTSILPVFSGTPTTHHLSAVRNHCLVISPNHLRTSEFLTDSRRMVYSLFAQASRLSLPLSQNPAGSNHRVHSVKDIEVCHRVLFEILIIPCYDPFQLLDMFMADSEYIFALSLTVSEPRLDSKSNRFSWPVIHWFCDLNLSNEISVEEAETLFGVKVRLHTGARQYRAPIKQLLTIIEINTMCGFDPALEGADICEYLNLPRMEIFENPVEVFADREFNQIALPALVHGHRDKDPVTHIRVEKELSSCRAQNRLIVILIALNIVLLSLVIHLFIKV